MQLIVVLGLALSWGSWCFLQGAEAQNPSCTTPAMQPGMCVPVEGCRNIYKIFQLTNNKIPPKILTYIRQSVCRLAGVTKAVCCQLSEIDKSVLVDKQGSKKPSLLPVECGIITTDRISNGQATAPFEFPWMALLRYKDNSGTITDGCGGSLINERYVLTAAHCLGVRRFALDHVRLGEHTKSKEQDCIGSEDDCAGPVQDIAVELEIVHPEYNKPKYANDIGLIRLVRNVMFEDHIKPICLPVTENYQNMLHPKYIITGWGTTEKNDLSDVLLKATLPRVDNSECQQVMASNRLTVLLSDKQICAGGKDLVDSCRGDSGGPLGTVGMLNGDARFIQFGIVSAGLNTCGERNVPGIFTRVGKYMSWIEDNLKPS
ncbi:serine protease grass [Culex quinquefasciatus]|uniref:serine protease grass n=1 Tax=Culex quinquefasciatus TaxID=7176 RepID=UPI0018E3B7D1|nr:serine protease grass [Culex quinquefasciatus]